jgi:hypothetical protein
MNNYAGVLALVRQENLLAFFFLSFFFFLRNMLVCISNSRASKGFSGSQTMQQCGCAEVFMDLLRLFGMALDTPSQRSQIQASSSLPSVSPTSQNQEWN